MAARGAFWPPPASRSRKCPAGQKQVGERKQREDLRAVLGDAAIADFAIAELAFDHAKHVLDLGANLAEPAVAAALRCR